MRFIGELLLGFVFITLIFIGINFLIFIRMAFTDAIYLEVAIETVIGLIAINYGSKWASNFIRTWKESGKGDDE